jgi:hypothetical protein
MGFRKCIRLAKGVLLEPGQKGFFALDWWPRPLTNGQPWKASLPRYSLQERPKRFLLAVALRAGRAALRADALELIPAGWVDIAECPLTKKEQSRASTALAWRDYRF